MAARDCRAVRVVRQRSLTGLGWHEPFERHQAATGDEAELLDYALGRSERSRLACQIRLVESMDGLAVEVPSQQG